MVISLKINGEVLIRISYLISLLEASLIPGTYMAIIARKTSYALF